MQPNRFTKYLSTDNDLCVPLSVGPGLIEIANLADQIDPQGPKPGIQLDLEHLQTLDYRQLPGMTDEQRKLIDQLNAENRPQPEEAIFLGLRSLLSVTWPKPTGIEDVKRAADYEAALNVIFAKTAFQMASAVKGGHQRMPYWARLSFLHFMCSVQEAAIDEYQLDKIACTPIWRNKFNATSFALDNSSVIAMNFALEPILKHLNRYFLHFKRVQEYDESSRLQRAWREIAPTVLYFCSHISAVRLPGPSLFYEAESAKEVHFRTATQVGFIVAHEVGHVILDHPRRFKKLAGQTYAKDMRHEFEFMADMFAMNGIRSGLFNNIRYLANPNRNVREGEEDRTVVDAVLEYSVDIESIELLFIYMDFIECAGEYLRDRLHGRLIFTEPSHSHPPASARWNNLKKANCSDYPLGLDASEFSRGFFLQLLDYMRTLSLEDLEKSVSERALI